MPPDFWKGKKPPIWQDFSELLAGSGREPPRWEEETPALLKGHEEASVGTLLQPAGQPTNNGNHGHHKTVPILQMGKLRQGCLLPEATPSVSSNARV